MVIGKYNTAKKNLEILLNDYTNKAYELNKKYLIDKGINYTSRFINNGTKLKYSANEPFGREELMIKNINTLI